VCARNDGATQCRFGPGAASGTAQSASHLGPATKKRAPEWTGRFHGAPASLAMEVAAGELLGMTDGMEFSNGIEWAR
jgi:hypothetical protein